MVDTKDEILTTAEQFAEAFSSLPPEERAYMVARNFFSVDDPDETMCEGFHRWLMSGNNVEAKQSAMERVMREHLSRADG